MSDKTAPRVDFAGILALSSRAAGYSVAKKCLEVQAAAEAIDPSLKTVRGVRLHEDARSWYVGALGEMQVGKFLEALGPEWFVRHAVPIGADTRDVDHLVIGPSGVYSINTKHHAGASIWGGDFVLKINNVDRHYNIRSFQDGADVAKRLTAKVGFHVTVIPTLAFLDPKSISDSSSHGKRRVSIINAVRLVGWLRAQPRLYSDTELALLKIAAEEPETWHVDPRAADTLRVMQRFERLVANVGTAPVRSAAVPRATPARVRAPRRAQPARSRGQSSRRKRSAGATGIDLLKAWFGVALTVGVVLVFRSFANQPCATPLECLVPVFYLALKPILVLGVGVMLSVGVIGTLVWAVRRARRR